MDTGQIKQFFKDADGPEALELYRWITGAMEVRGLIPIAGVVPKRKRRSDAGVPRNGEEPGDEEKRFMCGESSLQERLIK
jgi:hypothetical protein